MLVVLEAEPAVVRTLVRNVQVELVVQPVDGSGTVVGDHFFHPIAQMSDVLSVIKGVLTTFYDRIMHWMNSNV